MNVHIWITILLTLSLNKVIYSDSVIQLTATPYWNSFASHDGFDGTTHYPDNYTREWLITGETANYSILINITHCAIENAKGKCLFDYLSMYDGSNSNASVLQETCCTNILSFIYKPIVRSTDGTMYIVFNTDLTINDTGFKINYILEGAPTTTLSTSTPSTTTVLVPASVQTEDNTLIYIIIACAVTGVLLIIIIVLICVICCKKKANNRSKQQISKKLRRSAEPPVVVTSENSSHLIIEDEARDSRSSTVQNRSPPPAYATIVDDGNNVNTSVHVESVRNTNSQQKELLHEQSDTTSVVTMNTNNGIKISSTKTVKNKSKMPITNNNIKEKPDRKNKTEKGKNSSKEKIQVNKKDFDNEQAPPNLTHYAENKPRPHSDASIHKMSKALTESQNQEDNNDNKRKLLSYAESTHMMSEPIVLVKENEKAAYNITRSLDSRSAPVQPDAQIAGIEGALITPLNDTDLQTRTIAIETPVHRKAIKPGRKTDDKSITLDDRDNNETSTTIQNIDDKPVVQAHNNNRKTDKPVKKIKEIPISQEDKTDHQLIPPAHNHRKSLTSDNKIEEIPISQEEKHDENSLSPAHNDRKSEDNIDAIETLHEVKNDEQPTLPAQTNNPKTSKLDNKREATRISQEEPNDEKPLATTDFDDQSISPEHQNDRKTTKGSFTQDLKPISKEDNDGHLNSSKHKNDQKKIIPENKTDSIPISHQDTNDDEWILPALKNYRKTNELQNKDVSESITPMKTTEYPVTTQPAKYNKENTPTIRRDSIKAGKNKEKLPTALDHSNAQPHVPTVENDTTSNKTNDTPSIWSNKHHKRLITLLSDTDTKPSGSIINNDKEFLNNTVYDNKTENVLNDKTTDIDQSSYTLHDENEMMENEDDIYLSKNFNKHSFLGENEQLTKRDMTVVSDGNKVYRDLNVKPIFSRPPNDKNEQNGIVRKLSKTESVDNRSVQEPFVFTVSNGNTQNFVKTKDIISSTVPAPYRNNFMTNNRPITSSSQSKIAEEHYLDKMKILKSIYYSHSNYGLSDKNVYRMRSQLDLLRPQTSNINPWLVQPTSHNTSDNSNKRVTKATVLRRMRNMGVQEMNDDDIPQLIPKSQAFNIIKSRTTLCDEDIAQSRKKILPPLKGVPKQKFPDLPKLWQPT